MKGKTEEVLVVSLRNFLKWNFSSSELFGFLLLYLCLWSWVSFNIPNTGAGLALTRECERWNRFYLYQSRKFQVEISCISEVHKVQIEDYWFHYSFNSISNDCDILQNAYARYLNIIFGGSSSEGKSERGVADTLDVDLQSPCEDSPYLGMDETYTLNVWIKTDLVPMNLSKFL